MAKLFWVTSAHKLNKKQQLSRVIGFVTVFGWESAEVKATRKYPGHDNYGVHLAPLHRRGGK